ncbi:nuclease-related domain-containing protein [Micromonospora aurantiaca (nom. illeg.)]|uniref:nuclease-related domain-containing protein n=1 Tax=Micromonospora aurantiaca (nom. illeg.) TaxID=47850 RepID=UPI000828DEC7|nr:nuclease-related domain-containing protein [Micromonospora aurantiaca]SCL21318.1 Nuclease-related domain-containing protein [Micromonospora aurantiaca]SCL21450.1 Nuclease-related domain-containing protein [Micromonospora aurantiaca]
MVTTWKSVRGGRQRVHFDAADGTHLGYVDLATRQPGDVNLARAAEFYAALTRWRERNPAPPRTDAPELVQDLAPPPAPAGSAAPGAHLGNDAFGPPPDDPPVGVRIRETPAQRPAPPTGRAAGPGWTDLADNRPGQGAATVAEQLRRDRPVATFFARLLRLRTDERAWRIGAAGEVKTADYLRKLTRPGGGWYVLHSVPVSARGTDIDHVLIGPAGIFTINTKHHPRALVSTTPTGITVNRHPTAYAAKARAEADRAGRLLGAAIGRGPIAVTPVIAVVGAGVRGTYQPNGVTVIAASKLTRWLRRQTTVLAPDTVTKLHGIARRSTTWLP